MPSSFTFRPARFILFRALLLIGVMGTTPRLARAESPTVESNEFHFDTPVYRSAKALAVGLGEALAVPVDPAERLAFLTERGLWLLRLEQWKLAEADFLAVLQKAPKDVTARSGLALAAQRSGHSEAAQKRLEELKQELPNSFCAAPEAEDVAVAGLALIADHVLQRQRSGALVAGDLTENLHDFGPVELDARLEAAETAVENGSIESAETEVLAAIALGVRELPAIKRLQAQIAAAQAEIARLEPGEPSWAELHYTVEQRVRQALAREGAARREAVESNAYLMLERPLNDMANEAPESPTYAARRRLLARWLAVRNGAQESFEPISVQNGLKAAAKVFASTPNDGDATSAALAAENLAQLRTVAKNWPLTEVENLPSAWPEGELTKLVTEITSGESLRPGDVRVKKAIELWEAQRQAFSVESALETPEDTRRRADLYRIGAALTVFELITVPEGDSLRRTELTERIDQWVRMSNVQVNYVAAAGETLDDSKPWEKGPLHTHYQWQPVHWGTDRGKEAQAVYVRLEARAWELRRLLAEGAALPWKQLCRSFEAEYASYVAPTQIHDRSFLLILAQLRRKAGDIAGMLDLLPLLEQRTELGYDIASLHLPTTVYDIYPAELSAFVKSLRGTSPEVTAYADLTAWIEEVNRTRQITPLPEVAMELRTNPAVALQWTWAQIISGALSDAREALQPAEANAKNSVSFGLVAPELMLRVIWQLTSPLYDKGMKVWNSHAEDFDAASFKQQKEACTALMRRLLALKADPRWKMLKGGDRVEFQLAFAAGDFELAAKTEAGVDGERYVMSSARSEAAANDGIQAFFAGKLDEARAKLAQADAFEIVFNPRTKRRDDSVDDGEYVLFLRTLLGYHDMEGVLLKGRDVVALFEKTLKATKQPAHREAYRKFEEEIRIRCAYFENREEGRRRAAEYLSRLIFLQAARNPAFERACFMNPETVSNLLSASGSVDIKWLETQLYQGFPPAPEWDGHRVEVVQVENPNYAINKGKFFDAIVGERREEALALTDTPRTVAQRREYDVAEPAFWRYYREIRAAQKW